MDGASLCLQSVPASFFTSVQTAAEMAMFFTTTVGGAYPGILKPFKVDELWQLKYVD